jgi:hypothetical protein
MENKDTEKQKMEDIIKLYKIIISKKNVTIKQLQHKLDKTERIINNIRSKL